RLLIEADALTFVELVEAALDRTSMKEPLLAAMVANEPETSVPNESFDRAARHPSLLGQIAAQSRNIKFRSTECAPILAQIWFSPQAHVASGCRDWRQSPIPPIPKS